MRRTGKLIGLVSAVMLLLMLTTAILHTSTGTSWGTSSSGSAASTDAALSSGEDSVPPTSGDWYVDSISNVVINETFVVNGSLMINGSGSLTLVNTTMVFNVDDSDLVVAGTLILINSVITAGDGVTGLTVFFNDSSDVSLLESVLSNAAMLTMNSTAFVCEGSTLSDIGQWTVNNHTSMHNTTLEGFNLLVNNVTLDAYNILIREPADATALENGTINLYHLLSITALNGTGGPVTLAAYGIVDLQSDPVASGTTDVNGKAKLYLLVRWMNTSGWGGLPEALVNVSVTKAAYDEYAWTRMIEDVSLTIQPGNKAPVAIIDTADSGITYSDMMFNATNSFDPDDNNITLFQWDFGDGMTNSTTGAITYHAYQRPGDYRVSLSVSDQYGLTDNTTNDVHIDWVINRTVIVENESIELNADVIVLSNGSLTLRGVLLAFNESYNGEHSFDVTPGGELIIEDLDGDPLTTDDNSLITSGCIRGGNVQSVAGKGLIRVSPGTYFQLTNSVVDGFGWDGVNNGGLVIASDDVLIQGSMIRNNYVGIFLNFSGGTIKNVTISDTVIRDNKIGINLYQDEFTSDMDILGVDLVKNEFISIQTQSVLAGGGEVSLTDCYITQSNQGAYMMGEGTYTIRESVFYNTTQGIECLGLPATGVPVLNIVIDDVTFQMGDVALDTTNTQLIAYNTSFKDMAMLDLDINETSAVSLHNCTFNASKVNIPVLTSYLDAYWYLNVATLWPNGMPIENAFLNITDTGGGSVLTGHTPADGWIRYLEVFHYTRINNTDMDTTYHDTHMFIEASVFDTYFQNTDVFVNETTDLVITLTDTDSPLGSILINNGSTLSNSFTVDLDLTYSDIGSGVDAVAVSNFPFNATSTVWETPVASRLWGLEPLQGNHSVYYKVRDASGGESPVYTDSIDLDSINPASYVTPLVEYRKETSFNLVWGPKAGITDIASYEIQYSYDGEFWFKHDTEFTATETSTVWTEGNEGDTIYFRSIAKDIAGNVEVKTLHDTYTIIDSLAPQTALLPMDKYQTSLDVDLVWTGYDRTSGMVDYNIQYASVSSPDTWTDLTTGLTGESAEVAMPGQGGFYLRSIGSDKAGNKEIKPIDLFDIYIFVDSIPPEITATSVDVGDTKATVTWTTAEVSKGVLYFGTDPDDLQMKTDYTESTTHSILLHDLKENTKYYYKLKAIDVAGNDKIDDNGGSLYIFTTKASYGYITGMVTDPDGEPIKNAGIYLGNVYKGLSDPNGEYSYQVRAGDYKFMVAHLDYNTFVAFANVNVIAGQTVTQNAQLNPPGVTLGSLNLNVLHEKDALGDAVVQIKIGTDTVYSGKTNNNGVYELLMSSGNYTVSVSKSGYFAASSSFVITDGEATPVTLELEEIPEQETTLWVLRTNNMILTIIIVVTVLAIVMFFLFLFRDRLPERLNIFKKRSRKKKAGDDDEDEGDEDETVECPSCDTLVSVSQTRCPECGESLYEVIGDEDDVFVDDLEFDCPFCGEEMDPEEDVCGECGQDIPTDYKEEYYERLEEAEGRGKKKKDKKAPADEEEPDEEEELEAEEEAEEEEAPDEEEEVEEEEEPEEEEVVEEESLDSDEGEEETGGSQQEEAGEDDEELEEDAFHDLEELEDFGEDDDLEEADSWGDEDEDGDDDDGKNIEIVMI